MKLPCPAAFHRTTLDRLEDDPVFGAPGVYIVSYMSKIVYVGKSESSVGERLYSHVVHAEDESEHLGRWLIVNQDHANIAIDILEPPLDINIDMSSWLRQAEAVCIKRLRPLFNVQLT